MSSRVAAIGARLCRWRRWEFWPMWLFYAPVVPWIVWLSVRYRGLTTITASNPGIEDGGVVGESKFEILRRLPSDATIPAILLPSAETVAERVDAARRQVTAAGWAFPLIAKPDVGQRGVGVRLIRSFADLEAYLVQQTAAVLVQPFHEGPFEAGIFYVRFPSWPRGRILSITDKRFPVVVGDGSSTLEQLVGRHPRYRLQARLFLTRHREHAHRVLQAGERYQLAVAGNHAQGTLFLDGAPLWTPALEARIDRIARAYRGFYVGRFDVRYRDVAAFQAGRDLAIVELNGATAESTSLYDPQTSLWSAYRQLYQQWGIVFAIGAANRGRGERVTSPTRLARLIWTHLRSRPAFVLSD
jgi:hypothetical protein